MAFLLVGLLLLVLKIAEIGPVAGWSWLWVLAPFALAVAWWAWADSSGYTSRKAMERETSRRDARIERNKTALGTNFKKRR